MKKSAKDQKQGAGKAKVGRPDEPGPVAAQNVILERIEANMRVVIESVTMTREALERTIAAGDERLASRMGVLEIAVRQNSADIQKLAAKLDTKTDASRTSELEQRVDGLEATAG